MGMGLSQPGLAGGRSTSVVKSGLCLSARFISIDIIIVLH